MGAWGPGLYSDDFALDLRAMLSAVCRLPFDGAEIVSLLRDLEPASLSPDDEDYTTFWLVVADQLHKRGIPAAAQERALAIIDDGSNVAMLQELGMSPADLRKRQRALDKLREKLAGPAPEKPRRTLKRPQPLLMEPGQVYLYPVDSSGNCVNPYFTDATRPEFIRARWGSFLVVNAGHALGYLAWYELARARRLYKREPGLKKAVGAIDAARTGIGTLTRLHAERMQLELLGAIAPTSSRQPGEAETVRKTAADISVANLLSAWATPGRYG